MRTSCRRLMPEKLLPVGNANRWRLSDCRTVTNRHPVPAELCNLPPAHAPSTPCEREWRLGLGWGERARITRGRRATGIIAVALGASIMLCQPWLSQLSQVDGCRRISVPEPGWWWLVALQVSGSMPRRGQGSGPCGAHSAALRSPGVGSSSSSKMAIFMTPDLCWLLQPFHIVERSYRTYQDRLGSQRALRSYLARFPAPRQWGAPQPAPNQLRGRLSRHGEDTTFLDFL